jgi:hypothetical protein
MNRPALQSRDRRALLVGLMLVLPVLGYALAVQPYAAAVSRAQERLDAERSMLLREVAMLSAAPQLPAVLAQADSAARSALPRLFGGADGVTATAALAAYVGDRARGSRLLLQQSESRDAELPPGGVLRLTVSIRAVGDLEAILTFLHAIEAGPKLLRTERLGIEHVQRWTAAPAGGTAPLLLEATLSGFALPPAHEPGDGDPPHAGEAGG